MYQPYLPQLYVESDSDATSCYLFFRRMGYKADLINNVVAQIHNLPESLNGDVSEVLVGVCEVKYCLHHIMGDLSHVFVSSDAKQDFWFVNVMQTFCRRPPTLRR